jgi:hypothetical protein
MKKAIEGKLHLIPKHLQEKLRKAKKEYVQAKGQAGLWVEVFDPINQAFYYFDHATGANTWDKPVDYILAADDELMLAAIKIQVRYFEKY